MGVTRRAAPALLALVLAACTGASEAARSDDPWGNLKANALFERAEQYYAAGRYEEAIVDYNLYLDDYPSLHRANDAAFRIAQSLEAMGERSEAADAYRAVGLRWPRSTVAPPAHLRSGELYEIEGWLRDALMQYEYAARHLSTEAGTTALARLEAVKARIAEEEALRRSLREAGRRDAGDTPVHTSTMRPWPPQDRTVTDLLQRR